MKDFNLTVGTKWSHWSQTQRLKLTRWPSYMHQYVCAHVHVYVCSCVQNTNCTCGEKYVLCFRGWRCWQVHLFEAHLSGLGKWRVKLPWQIWLHISCCLEVCQKKPNFRRHGCWAAWCLGKTQGFFTKYQTYPWRRNKSKSSSSPGWIWWIHRGNKSWCWQHFDQGSSTFLHPSHIKRHKRSCWTQTIHGCWGWNHRIWSRKSGRVHFQILREWWKV